MSQPLGLSGMPSSRPLLGGAEQCFLHGVLADVELAVAAYEDAEDLRRECAQQALHLSVHMPSSIEGSQTGRISMPSLWASGRVTAWAMTCSMSSASTR